MMMTDSTRKSWFTLLLALCLCSFFFFTRVYWYTPWCSTIPTPCLPENVNAIDRIVFQFKSVNADFWSNVIQNFVGTVVFVAPWALFSKKIALEETRNTATITFWNLAIMEAVSALVQRPRPLVFNSVLGDGLKISQYNSFYSGHTSFVALASLSFFLMVRRRFPTISSTTRGCLLFGYITLTVLTGTLRVLGGRHYPTDVLAGLIIGSGIAVYFQKKY